MVVFVASWASAACAPPAAVARKAAYPTYEGRFAELFDDAIEASAVGLSVNARPTPRSDAVLQERAHVSDGIVKVRVKTVTTKTEGDQMAYVLEFEPFARLGGKHAPASSFSIRFDKAAPAFGIARSFEGRLVGKTFIAFVRQFTNGGGDDAFHIHLAPSTPDVEAAVREAMLLDELH